jgi:MED7 protein
VGVSTAAAAAGVAASAVDAPEAGGGSASVQQQQQQFFFLQPPKIPIEALQRGTRRAAVAAAKARAESERLRLGEQEEEDDDDEDGSKKRTDAILGGVLPTMAMAASQEQQQQQAKEQEEAEQGAVVAVFGEIVEDALLVEPLDGRCEDPRIVRDQVKRLNQRVVHGFVQLVQDLVHRPLANKYVLYCIVSYSTSSPLVLQRPHYSIFNILAAPGVFPFLMHHCFSFLFSLLRSALLLRYLSLSFFLSRSFRKTRDELSHNVFLMLQECNKFREHQARELLIQLLEKQLEERTVLLQELQANIAEADAELLL